MPGSSGNWGPLLTCGSSPRSQGSIKTWRILSHKHASQRQLLLSNAGSSLSAVSEVFAGRGVPWNPPVLNRISNVRPCIRCLVETLKRSGTRRQQTMSQHNPPSNAVAHYERVPRPLSNPSVNVQFDSWSRMESNRFFSVWPDFP